MATIDIRANVTCSLGDLISGSISDDLLQGSGLVKTRGDCELNGIYTPDVGTQVTFAYTKDGTSTSIPRKLRVLSSFADPFRKITKVQLGCKLTYFDNVTPAPTVDGEAAVTSGLQQQCLNGYSEYPADSPVPIPVQAAGVMQTCLTKLGIAASSNPLTNIFNIETFDLSAGYVSVLNDLLLSEGYFGYLDANEVLQVRSLNSETGTGPVITSDEIIDLDAIGTGDLPGEAVVVRYDSIKLNEQIDAENSTAISEQKRNWEFEESAGTPQAIEVRYSLNGTTYTNIFTYIPFSKTVTTYGSDDSWNSFSCVIASSRLEGADLSNSVIKRVTKQRTLVADSANNYCSQVFGIGGAPGAELTSEITTEEQYQYNNNGDVIKRVTRTYEPAFKWAGGIGIDFVYGTEYITLSKDPVLVEEVIEEYENIYAQPPRLVYLKPGDQFEPIVDGQKITTTTYRNWALTIGGQQGSASIKDLAPFNTATDCSAWLNYASNVMVMVDAQVRTNRGRLLTAGQVRSKQSLLSGQSNGSSRETTAQLAYAVGSASAERFITFSLPYQSDDVFLADGTIRKGDAEAKALNFGRIQNRLLLGNRNGVNHQLHPNYIPAAPFSPLYLSDGNLMVQYRANGLNWAFSNEGVVAGVDALFWGVAGGTGTAWVPVAPGITTFPALPTITPPSGSTPATTNVDYLTPVWNETVALTGTTFSRATITAYPYTIGLLTTTPLSARTRTVYLVQTNLAAANGTYAVTGQNTGFAYTRKFSATAGAFALAGQSAGNVRDFAIGTNAGTFELSAPDISLLYNRIFSVSDTSFILTGADAGSFTGKTLNAQPADFTLSGQDSASARSYALTSTADTFTVSGQAANFTYTSPSFNFIEYTGTAAASSITTVGFQPSLVWINAKSANYAYGWYVFDAVRGAGAYSQWEDYRQYANDPQSLTAFTSSGFSLGTSTSVNSSSASDKFFEAYCWKGAGSSASNTSGTITSTVNASSASGVSVFTYTGNGVGGAQVGHGLTSPDFVIVRCTTVGSFTCDARANSPFLGGAYNWNLQGTGTPSSDTSHIRSVNASTITVGNSGNVNEAGNTYLGLAFKSVAGISQIGVTTGDGTSTLNVSLGFMPRFLLVRSYVSSGNWFVYRPTSGTTGYATYVYLNTHIAPTLSTNVQMTSTGFSVDVGGPGNVSGGTNGILYMAYA